MAEDALARARAIAARLSGGISGGSDLGKRKHDDSFSGAGLGAIKKKKLYIPVKDHPDVNFLGLLIGPRGSTQKQLQEMSGAKIIIRGRGSQKDGAAPTGHPDDDDELHVSIEGTDQAIEKASQEVQQILYNPEQAMRLKQEQLRNLATMNGGVPSDSYGPSRSESGEGYQVELRVPNNMVGLVIGKGGENIHRMQSQTGAHMQIAKESDMKPGETLRSIILKGSPDGVAELKKLVEEVINSRMNTSTSTTISKTSVMTKELDHAFVIKIAVPNDKVGVIIGKGGMTIKTIQERTRATIQIPPAADEDNPENRTLSIGADTKEAADAAQMEIYLALQMQQQQAAQQAMAAPANAVYIAVPDDKVGLIIGKGGVTIKDIQSRCRVKIQIPPSADPGVMPPVRTCSIIGTAEAQHMARYEIEMVLQGQPHPSTSSSYHSQSQYSSSWSSASAYGAAAAYNPYGAMYGAYAAGMVDPATASYYGAAYGAQYAAAAAPAPAAAPADPNDPTAYYNDFWQYASYYGEAAARVYYGAWSPPEGTAPPAGIVLPATDPSAAATAALAAAPTSETSDEAKEPEAAAAAAVASTGESAGENTDSAAGEGGAAGESGSSATTGEAAPAGSAEAKEGATAEGSGAAPSTGGAPEDPEAAAAWEAYQKQYRDWYEAYGKAAGADPNPPQG